MVHTLFIIADSVNRNCVVDRVEQRTGGHEILFNSDMRRHFHGDFIASCTVGYFVKLKDFDLKVDTLDLLLQSVSISVELVVWTIQIARWSVVIALTISKAIQGSKYKKNSTFHLIWINCLTKKRDLRFHI